MEKMEKKCEQLCMPDLGILSRLMKLLKEGEQGFRCPADL